jgi:uncharacterized membrane protein YdjX (TVP38/TMEM64 family)
MSAAAPEAGRSLGPARRLLPLLALVAALVAALLLRPQSVLTLAELAAHRVALLDWVGRHYGIALLAFGAIYFTTKLLFVPTGPFLAAAGGFLLGIVPATLTASTAGLLAAIAVFLAIDHGLGQQLRARALPFLDRVGAGFRRHGWSYLLAMRLLPIMPFSVASIVPALLGLPLRLYALATLIGGLPSILVYTAIGSGLGRVLDEGKTDLGVLSDARIVLPLAALAALSLVPVLWARRAR